MALVRSLPVVLGRVAPLGAGAAAGRVAVAGAPLLLLLGRHLGLQVRRFRRRIAAGETQDEINHFNRPPSNHSERSDTQRPFSSFMVLVTTTSPKRFSAFWMSLDMGGSVSVGILIRLE